MSTAEYRLKPVQSLQQSSPLDTLVRRTSSRRAARPSPQPAPSPEREPPRNEYNSRYQDQLHDADTSQTLGTPPKTAGKGRPPSSPLLHTRFRTSTGTTSSYNTFGASFDRSLGDISQDSDHYQDRLHDDDESVYSTISPHASRQLNPHGAYNSPEHGRASARYTAEYEGRASEDADAQRFYYSGVPSEMMYRESWQSSGTVRQGPARPDSNVNPVRTRPRKSSDVDPYAFQHLADASQGPDAAPVPDVPTVVISSAEASTSPSDSALYSTPPPPMGSSSSRAGRVPSALPLGAETNYSRPRRPVDIASEDSKRAVLERNAYRSQRSPNSGGRTPSPTSSRNAFSPASPGISPSPSPSSFTSAASSRAPSPHRAPSTQRAQSPAMPPPTSPLPPPPSQVIEVPRNPPPLSSASPTSLYSSYSYYPPEKLDAVSPSPTQSTLQVPGAPPPPSSPTHSSRPTTPTAGPNTADDYLQLGIKHHEANRLTESALCFEKAAALDEGGVGALMWGLALRHGWGCAKDEKRAFGWLRRAAERAVGDLERARTDGVGEGQLGAVRTELVLAIYEVGQCFFQGWGVKKDQKMGVSYFQVAAKLGDADAQQELAFCLLNGKGCKKNRKEAAKWYRAAVAQGASDVGLAWIYKEKFQ